MTNILCRLGFHSWGSSRIPDEKLSPANLVYTCARCGDEKHVWLDFENMGSYEAIIPAARAALIRQCGDWRKVS
jgi:hypothetical protein